MSKQLLDKYNYIKAFTSQKDNIFTTTNPEITFFKSVYRKYSNFASNIINLDFDSNNNSSSFTEIIIPKAGDLLSKLYLEINLPECFFPVKEKVEINVKNLDTIILLFQNLFTINNKMIKDYFEIVKVNESYSSWIIEITQEYKNFDIYDSAFNSYLTEMVDYVNSTFNKNYSLSDTFDYNALNLNCFGSISEDIENEILIIQQNNKDFYFLLNSILYNVYTRDFKNESYKYAWIKNLGYSIIDYVDLYIGDLKITRDYGQLIFINDQLTKSENEKEMLNDLTGNVEKLINFDNKKKEEYSLILPLNFWFCKNYSSALPLTNMVYEDVILRFKFREYKNLAYIEKPNLNNVTEDSELEEIENRYGQDLFDNSKINIRLIAEYIYLNEDERKYIASRPQKYLIQQNQIYEEIIDNQFYNIQENKLNIRISNFEHPSKCLIWFFQPLEYYYNLDKYTECKFCNFTINDKSPFDYCGIYLNMNLLVHQDKTFFEYLQPYQHLNNSGIDGVYTYWFSLKPLELQPTGNINFSRIKEIMLSLEFNKSIPIKSYDKFIFKCFTINYNILEIENGFVNLIYN